MSREDLIRRYREEIVLPALPREFDLEIKEFENRWLKELGKETGNIVSKSIWSDNLCKT